MDSRLSIPVHIFSDEKSLIRVYKSDSYVIIFVFSMV